MPKPSAQPAETTTPSKLPELLFTFDSASLKEQAEFALMRCASMARVGQEIYGPFTDVREATLDLSRRRAKALLMAEAPPWYATAQPGQSPLPPLGWCRGAAFAEKRRASFFSVDRSR